MTAPDPLLAAIRAVPMQCSTCGLYSNTEAASSDSICDFHSWETDDAGIAQAVRALLRKRVTREMIAQAVCGAAWTTYRAGERESAMQDADAVLALLRRELGDD